MMRAAYLVHRNALVYRRVWRGSAFSSFIQPILFLFAIGMGVGGMMGSAHSLPGGVSYAQFLAPGLLAAAAMQQAGFESSYPVLGKMTWFRNYEAITATPMGVHDLVIGELSWLALRLSSIATAFMIVMTVFDIPRSPLVLLTLPVVVLTGIAFAAPIMAYAATRKNSATFNVMFRFVLTPLFMFSGVFFPVSALPTALQRVAWGTPLFHGVELIRGLTLAAVPPTWPYHLGYLVCLAAVGIALAFRTFERRLNA